MVLKKAINGKKSLFQHSCTVVLATSRRDDLATVFLAATLIHMQGGDMLATMPNSYLFYHHVLCVLI